MKYRVSRQHLGDRMYFPGDEREAVAGDVQHLIDSGILSPLEVEEEKTPAKAKKAMTPPENK